MKSDNFCQYGKNVVDIELTAIHHLRDKIAESFADACELMLACEGRVIVMGMGKSGHIGSKIAATLASTGTPAFFVHPGEASHGDMGMVTHKDVVLALSNSGETAELLTLVPLLKRLQVPLIGLTGNPQSTLAQAANVHLDTGVAKEACPLGLAPTASTTVTLVLGDALAVALLEVRGFTEEDFALSHPGGALGKRLLLVIDDLMHAGDDVPRVPIGTSLREALFEISNKKLGMTAVVDEQGKPVGIYTDGDLRRTLDSEINIHTANVDDVMTRQFKRIKPGMLAVEALDIMRQHKITSLLVIDEDKDDSLVGVLHMHALLQAGVV